MEKPKVDDEMSDGAKNFICPQSKNMGAGSKNQGFLDDQDSEMNQNKQEATELGEKEKSDAKNDTDFELEAIKETKAIQGQEVNQKRENQGDQKI